MQRYLFCYYIKYLHGFEDSVFFILVEVLKFTDAIDQCLLPKSLLCAETIAARLKIIMLLQL